MIKIIILFKNINIINLQIKKLLKIDIRFKINHQKYKFI